MPSSIKTTNISQGGSLSGVARKMKIGFIGQSNGKLVFTSDKALVYDGTSQVIDSTASIEEITQVSLYQNDVFNVFKKDVDYQLSGSSIVWLDSPMSPPELEGVATSTGAADTTGNFVITVLDQNGNESTPSELLELTYKLSGVSIAFNWTKVAFASGYNLYIKNGSNYNLLDTYDDLITSATITNLTGTGTYTLATNDTKKTPKLNDPYYISYNAVEYNYTVQVMQSSKEVKDFYGMGSDLDNMGKLAFDSVNIAECYMCATNGTNQQAYLDAVDKMESITDIPLLICVLNNAKNVNLYAFKHAQDMSKDEIKKERLAVMGILNSIVTVGTSSTVGTILYELASYDNDKRGCFVIPNGNKMYVNEWRETTGLITENKLADNSFFAGTVAALMINADDSASSVIGVSVPGWNFGVTAPPWRDDIEKDKIEAAGGLYVYNRNGVPVIYTDVTRYTLTAEGQERYIVTAEDEVRGDTRDSLVKYIGKKLVKGRLRAIERTIDDVLSLKVEKNIIETYRDISAVQHATVKTRVVVSFWYTPMYAIKEIFVEYSYDLKTNIQ